MRRALTIAGLLLLMLIPAQALADRLVYIDVVGGPGDAERALAGALSERLMAQGLALSGTPAPGAFEIQGTVRLEPARGGKQSVRIDWVVFDAQGERLGIVTQERAVRRGSLDRKWGRAADAAAEAAATDILKLLPPQ